MILERAVIKVKYGHEQALVALVKEVPRIEPLPKEWRLYTPRHSRQGVVVIEWLYESMADIEPFWEAQHASPEWRAWIEKFNEHVVCGEVNEVWDLALQGP